jgi:predicted  nucleic acid-binding Zn-ribbon protein
MGDKGKALVEALKKENLKLHQRLVKLEGELISARNHIQALEGERGKTGLENLSDAELLARYRKLESQLGAGRGKTKK